MSINEYLCCEVFLLIYKDRKRGSSNDLTWSRYFSRTKGDGWLKFGSVLLYVREEREYHKLSVFSFIFLFSLALPYISTNAPSLGLCGWFMLYAGEGIAALLSSCRMLLYVRQGRDVRGFTKGFNLDLSSKRGHGLTNPQEEEEEEERKKKKVEEGLNSARW